MEAPNFYNEMLDADGAIRPHYEAYVRWLNDMPPGKINAKRAEAGDHVGDQVDADGFHCQTLAGDLLRPAGKSPCPGHK